VKFLNDNKGCCLGRGCWWRGECREIRLNKFELIRKYILFMLFIAITYCSCSGYKTAIRQPGRMDVVQIAIGAIVVKEKIARGF